MHVSFIASRDSVYTSYTFSVCVCMCVCVTLAKGGPGDTYWTTTSTETVLNTLPGVHTPGDFTSSSVEGKIKAEVEGGCDPSEGGQMSLAYISFDVVTKLFQV